MAEGHMIRQINSAVAKQLVVDRILIPANVSCLSINSFPTYFILFSWKQDKTELTGASSCLLLPHPRSD
ncbi:hypothetical protein KY285_010743 [Solanum tuberosum]|nr:hypothetical protein KY289_011315 [Solanum tuberosum]KAH0735036.1 hypothetical protein KY285_010743 [Solanum tuberosum]